MQFASINSTIKAFNMLDGDGGILLGDCSDDLEIEK